MKLTLLALTAMLATAAHADTYYCKLQNVPAVKTALNQALADVDAATNQANPTGEVTQATIKAMGDAFDYWGTDLLIYKLDGIANDNYTAVTLKVQYNSILAKALNEEDPSQSFTCSDTNETNPEILYVDGEKANGENITATPVKF